MAERSWLDHVSSGAAWRRFGVMLVLLVVVTCVAFLVFLTSVFQFFGVLSSGEVNPHLSRFGSELAQLTRDIIAFLTYNTEKRPFPFSEWTDEGGAKQSGSGRRSTAHRARRSVRRPLRPRRKKAEELPATEDNGTEAATDPASEQSTSDDQSPSEDGPSSTHSDH